MDLDTVIHNGRVVTVDAQTQVFERGWVGIANGVIRAVAPGAPDWPALTISSVIDAQGGIIMPGLVNAHSHLPMTLFRGLADDLPVASWLNEHIFPAEARFVNPKTVHWGTLLAAAEMLLSGTTCCGDGYFHEDAVARAVAEAGLRAVLGQGIVDFPAPGVPDPAYNVRHARRYAETWRHCSDRITPSLFCHAPYTCSAATLRAAKAVSDDLGLRLQIHVAETRQERARALRDQGLSPVAYLDRLGLLDENTLLSHAVWVDATDVAVMADRGCAVVHCPQSNMKMGSGIAPVAAMCSAGIPVALGTDGCASNNDLDMFGEMDTTAKLQKLATADPTALDAPRVVRMATIDGARALGLADQIGSLEVGKQADILVLDARAPHLTPMYRPISHIVYAARRSDVRHVLVAGQTMVVDRQLATIAVGTVMERVNAIAEEIRSSR